MIKCETCSANEFITKMERGQRTRLQRDMWELCDENRKLGGKHWKSVIKRFGFTENEVWQNARLQGCERSEHTLQGVVGGSE